MESVSASTIQKKEHKQQFVTLVIIVVNFYILKLQAEAIACFFDESFDVSGEKCIKIE